ncbi:MAG: threonine synthase, partial [Candidatus Bathyarchaeota archaeon B23]
MSSRFRCGLCGRRYPPGRRVRCLCGGLLEVEHDLDEGLTPSLFDGRLGARLPPYNSGVWRFKELIHPGIEERLIVSRGEGNTNLYRHGGLSAYVGLQRLWVKHEGENPTGSFKDRGMTVGISEARRLGVETVVCASTGNTSASLAAYAAQAEMRCIVLIPQGGVAYGKLAQAVAYGARVLQVEGGFDAAMRLLEEAVRALGLYPLNSINPWRLEGQKAILLELLQQRGWRPPDWVVLPAGNLGNTSAFGKALREMVELGLVDEPPRLAAIQAEGANPFYRLWRGGGTELQPLENPRTVASAIRIGRPVNWRRALRAIRWSGGVVEQVSDQEIMDAKAVVDRCGIGCEPAS